MPSLDLPTVRTYYTDLAIIHGETPPAPEHTHPLHKKEEHDNKDKQQKKDTTSDLHKHIVRKRKHKITDLQKPQRENVSQNDAVTQSPYAFDTNTKSATNEKEVEYEDKIDSKSADSVEENTTTETSPQDDLQSMIDGAGPSVIPEEKSSGISIKRKYDEEDEKDVTEGEKKKFITFDQEGKEIKTKKEEDEKEDKDDKKSEEVKTKEGATQNNEEAKNSEEKGVKETDHDSDADKSETNKNGEKETEGRKTEDVDKKSDSEKVDTSEKVAVDEKFTEQKEGKKEAEKESIVKTSKEDIEPKEHTPTRPEKIRELRTKRDEYSAIIRETLSNAEPIRRELDEHRTVEKAIQNDLLPVKEREQDLDDQIRSLEVQIKVAQSVERRHLLEDQRWELEDARQEVERERWEIEDKLTVVEERSRLSHEELEQYEDQIRDIRNQLHATEEEIITLENEEETEHIEAEMSDIEEQWVHNEKETEKIDNELASLDKTIETLVSQKRKIEDEERLTRSRSERQKTEEERQRFETKRRELEQERRELENKKRNIQEKMDDLKPAYRILDARLERLKNIA
jgi:hypothetical protein